GGGAGGGVGGGCDGANACSGLMPTAVTGEVRVTDMVFTGANDLVVGIYSGTVSFGGPQLSTAEGAWSGFLVELDASGGFVRQLAIPEATEASKLVVDFEAGVMSGVGLVAVGGDHGSGGACAGAGLFMHRLNAAGAAFEDEASLAPSCTAFEGEVDVADVDLSEYGYAILVGTANGTISGASSAGTHGFSLGFENTANTPDPPYFLGGTGESALAGIISNEVDPNQSLLVGDFAGQLAIGPIPNAGLTAQADAAGRGLFVLAIDQFPDDPNLELVTFGTSGQQRAVSMISGDTPVDGEVHLLAMIEGTLDLGGGAIAESTADPTALVLTFTAPNPPSSMATPGTYAYRSHYVFSAPELDMRGLAASGDRIHVGGVARGTISGGGSALGVHTIETASCARDAFVLTIQPSVDSVDSQRCGDGSQSFQGLVSSTGMGYTAALGLPANGAIDFGVGAMPQPLPQLLFLSSGPL
ncbi:MAG: hypothetical protein KC731_16720, partial [Myxococcales bacterium]|nr:hypothetical protein [Myxococcales bacterium]